MFPNLTEASLTVPLTPLGTEFLDRHKQLDIRIGRRFLLDRLRIHGQVNIFNVLNANPVEIYGTSTTESRATCSHHRYCRRVWSRRACCWSSEGV